MAKQRGVTPEILVEQVLDALETNRDWTRRQAEIALGSGVLIAAVLFCSMTLIFAQIAGQAAAPAPTPTTIPLGTHSASDVLTRLKQVGVKVVATQNIAMPNTTWQASQAIQFTVGASRFLVLSYATIDKAGGDAFRVSVATPASFSGWSITEVANVLLAAAPNDDPVIVTELLSHLTTYLLAPYRPVLLTATASPGPSPNCEVKTSLCSASFAPENHYRHLIH